MIIETAYKSVEIFKIPALDKEPAPIRMLGSISVGVINSRAKGPVVVFKPEVALVR